MWHSFLPSTLHSWWKWRKKLILFILPQGLIPPSHLSSPAAETLPYGFLLMAVVFFCASRVGRGFWNCLLIKKKKNYKKVISFSDTEVSFQKYCLNILFWPLPHGKFECVALSWSKNAAIHSTTLLTLVWNQVMIVVCLYFSVHKKPWQAWKSSLPILLTKQENNLAEISSLYILLYYPLFVYLLLSLFPDLTVLKINRTTPAPYVQMPQGRRELFFSWLTVL